MGFSLGGLVELGTLGLVDDPFGTEAATEAGLQGQREGMAAEERMFNTGLDFQREMWDWQKEQAAPWTEAGLRALGQYTDLTNQGFTYSPESDPIYAASLAEKTKSITSGARAAGMRLSGRTLRDLSRATASELAAGYGRSFDAYQSKLNSLSNIINAGRGAGMGLQQLGSQYSAGVGAGYQNLGSSLSQGYQNMGAIRAQGATADFQNLLSLGSTAGGLMMGAGALGFGAGAGAGTMGLSSMGPMMGATYGAW